MSDAEITADQHAARRAAITAELRRTTGIDETMIEKVVRQFYLKIQEDSLLGPIFSAHITDWEPHLRKMFAFWSSVTLMTGAYHGRPMQAHALLPVDARHFDRWLALFAETAREFCPPNAASVFIERAGTIATSLEMGIATVNGVRLARGARYRNSALA